jgi:hypothetical protein
MAQTISKVSSPTASNETFIDGEIENISPAFKALVSVAV